MQCSESEDSDSSGDDWEEQKEGLSMIIEVTMQMTLTLEEVEEEVTDMIQSWSMHQGAGIILLSEGINWTRKELQIDQGLGDARIKDFNLKKQQNSLTPDGLVYIHS